jgi:CBS domain-containing protein
MSNSQIHRGSDRGPAFAHARVEDVMHPGAAAALSGSDAEAGDVCSTEIVTVEAGEPLARAVRLMIEQQLTHLLVVSAKAQPVGIVSTLDVAGCLARGEA